MADTLSIVISVLALVISALTAWLTLFRLGSVAMTQPTIIFFGPDGLAKAVDNPPPKVFLRTLLFSTSKRGRVIESMHISLSRNETRQNFNIWVYGNEKLVRGSGLFVGETGIAANHHFLTPKDGTSFRFTEGEYTIDVYAKLVGDSVPLQLWSQQLEVSSDIANELKEPKAGLYFDWGPDTGRYIAHVDKRRPTQIPEELLKWSA